MLPQEARSRSSRVTPPRSPSDSVSTADKITAARSECRERELEQAIIDRIEAFLLELGKGLCFVARQKRLTLDGDHFSVDLVDFGDVG